MDISLAKLEQLMAVARAQSFSRAAEDLGISQPALSRSIAFLEQRYGLKLFERGRNGAMVTSAGTQILEEVQALLNNAHDLDRNLLLYGRGHLGSVSFGLSPQLGGVLLQPIILALFRDRPKISVKATVRSAPDLMEALISDRMEFFLCMDTQLDPHPEVTVTPLGASPVIFAVRAGHPLTLRTALSIDELGDYPFVSPVEQAQPPGSRARAGVICDNYHIMREVVKQSDFVFGCMRQFVEADIAAGKIVELTVSDGPLTPRPVFMAKRKNRTLSTIAAEIVELGSRSFARTQQGAPAV